MVTFSPLSFEQHRTNIGHPLPKVVGDIAQSNGAGRFVAHAGRAWWRCEMEREATMRRCETTTFNMFAAGFRSAITYLITSGHREHSPSGLGERAGQVGPETHIPQTRGSGHETMRTIFVLTTRIEHEVGDGRWMHTRKRMEQRGPGDESMIIHIRDKTPNLSLQPKLGRGGSTTITSNSIPPTN